MDFKNTVIILTSNLGSDIILNDLEQRRAEGSNELSADARKQIDLLLKSKFRPEFLNRLDEIVYYKSLTKDETRKIVDLQLEDLRHRMDEGKHLKLDVTTAAKEMCIRDRITSATKSVILPSSIIKDNQLYFLIIIY